MGQVERIDKTTNEVKKSLLKTHILGLVGLAVAVVALVIALVR